MRRCEALRVHYVVLQPQIYLNTFQTFHVTTVDWYTYRVLLPLYYIRCAYHKALFIFFLELFGTLPFSWNRLESEPSASFFLELGTTGQSVAQSERPLSKPHSQLLADIEKGVDDQPRVTAFPISLSDRSPFADFSFVLSLRQV